MPTNIFTKQIAEYLEVPLNVAESVQDVIDKYFYLDWNDCDNFEMHATFLAAYQFYKNEI
jgi:hypothetical protein